MSTRVATTRKRSPRKKDARREAGPKAAARKAAARKAAARKGASRQGAAQNVAAGKQAAHATSPRTNEARTKTAEQKRHAQKVVRRLARAYPDAHCSLDHRSPLELLVATILSAQCTDERVNMVTPALFAKYPTAAHYAAVSQEELEEGIKSTGFYRNKTKSLRGMGAMLAEDFDGSVPDTMDELLRLPGVARKTANVVLGNAFGIASGVVVDTHVTRISRLLGLTEETDAKKIELDLVALVPKKEWVSFSHRVIDHGRAVCIARRPRCAACALADVCPSAQL